MNKKIMIIVGVAVLLGGSAAAYFMFASTPAEDGEKDKFSGPPALVTMETFLANISDGDEERFAKLELRLAVVPSATAATLNEDELLQAKMRDRVLTLLTSKSYGDLSTPIGKEGFRREIKTVLTPLVKDGEIQEVLFQELVVQ